MKFFSHFIFKLSEWKVIGQFPAGIRKCVVIAAPHTSNWDFVVGVMAAAILDIRYRFLGKKELFVFPFGLLFRWLGGIMVERNKHTQLVDSAVDIFNKNEDLILAMSPEGTRKKIDKWHSGFYYIALSARVQVVTIYIDYKKREVGFGPVLKPSGDYFQDIKALRNFYKTVIAKYPENFEPDFQ